MGRKRLSKHEQICTCGICKQEWIDTKTKTVQEATYADDSKKDLPTQAAQCEVNKRTTVTT